MISPETFRALAARLDDDVKWAESLKPPEDPDDFALELAFVICNSGMKNTVARGIYERVAKQLISGGPITAVFRHPGKAIAIRGIWMRREYLFRQFQAAPDKLAWLRTLPWIGPVTCYHAAKNFGVDCCKPDVHLVRLAETFKTTPDQLCRSLAQQTGYRVATIDTVLWRACATGLLNSRTGEVNL